MTLSEFEEISKRCGLATNVDIVSRMGHNKESLEWFLRNDLSPIVVDGTEYLCTSNATYIEFLEKLRVVKNRSSAVRMFSNAGKLKRLLKSRDQDIVRTWDVIRNEKLDIDMSSRWSIPYCRWICIDLADRNAAKALETATVDILTRGMRNDT